MIVARETERGVIDLSKLQMGFTSHQYHRTVLMHFKL
jgi:hypothetical protein